MGFSILAAEGALTSVGLMGQRAELALLPFVNGEKTYFGSFWGNHNDLTEVLSLAAAGQIKHNIVPVKLDAINDNLDALGRGDIVGRAVVLAEPSSTDRGYTSVFSTSEISSRAAGPDDAGF